MKKIGLIGGGELASQVKRFIIEYNCEVSEFYYFDDILYAKNNINTFKFDDYILDKFESFEFYVCLGYKNPSKKKQVIHELVHKGRSIPSLIHKTAYISPGAIVEDGVIIYPMCNIDKNSLIRKGTILNNSVVISHDNDIGESCYISPSVTTSGFVKIGDKTFIGTMSAISNHIKVGEDCIIGIGTVINANIKSGLSVIGNPMKILEEKLFIK